MKLHARNLAASLGAKGKTIDKIVDLLSERKLKVTYDNVKTIYEEIS